MAWVQLLAVKQIEQAGSTRTYHPGDYVEVGGQTARRWVADAIARYPDRRVASAEAFAGCGVVVMGTGSTSVLSDLKLDHKRGDLMLSYNRTLFWRPDFHFRSETLEPGFHLLKTWDCAAPLVSYEQLALHAGTDEDRARTKQVIRDLRVPLYETRMMFVRRNTIGRALIDAWKAELESGGDERLAFLRAFYTVKPRMNALPTTWKKA
jgi:hypothetical protein